MKHFNAPLKTLGDLDPKAAFGLLAASSDVALILDEKGVVRDLALGSDEISLDDCGDWLGQPWEKTVTVESREKIEDLLRDAAKQKAPRWRQVNHPSTSGGDLPVLYSALRVGDKGKVIALGRNLREFAVLQQRLVEAQQAVEREYARQRSAETRYRLLFQVSSEPVLIVDAASQQIIEANTAAEAFLKAYANKTKRPRKTVGSTFPDVLRGLKAGGRKAIDHLLATVRSAGRGEDVRVATDGDERFSVGASLFRHENASYFLVRFAPLNRDGSVFESGPRSRMLELVEAAPDGFVMTSLDGRILSTNRAFLDLAQLGSEEQARGQPLERWLGRPGVDWSVLRANLRENQAIRLFASSVQGEQGLVAQVEISAVAVTEGELPCYGFMIRNVGQRLKSSNPAGKTVPRSVEQLTGLVGRVSLKEIVRETTDVIEQLCIEAALELTGDNRASAAEMLGVSRQSLYVKLRRFGLADVAPEEEA
ncbi:transcriptional regulator PpsR [Pelagibius sp.]|uniref:transcriptional regulator PpsR n=1 Tax=Pelagibius sp. TaxID=1931238 RepID=UPI003B500DB9